MKVVDLVLISTNQFWDAKNQKESILMTDIMFRFKAGIFPKKIDVGMV